MKIGILGCGVISKTYIEDINKFYGELEIEACADADLERARTTAEEYHIPKALMPEELLADKEIELIVNLTPPKFHYSLNKQILEAGKNVFCEKPFALKLEEAEHLRRLAESKGLYSASAPDTFLGAGIQRARKILEEGGIGTPLYVNANMMSCGMELWHVAPEAFYQEGAGPLYDMGPYYLTTLVVLFGSIEKIAAVSGKGFQERKIYCGVNAGKNFSVEVPTYYSCVLTMKNGVKATLTISFDIFSSSLPFMEIYGTEGTLKMPDPNMTAGFPEVITREAVLHQALGRKTEQVDSPFSKEVQEKMFPTMKGYLRGAGVAELARAVERREEAAVNAKLSCHVVEAMNGIEIAAKMQKIYEMRTEV